MEDSPEQLRGKIATWLGKLPAADSFSLDITKLGALASRASGHVGELRNFSLKGTLSLFFPLLLLKDYIHL